MLKELSAKTANNVDDMNNYIEEYHIALANIIKESGVLSMFNGDVGGEEMNSMKMLVGGLMSARIDADSMKAMKSALDTEIAGQLKAIYEDMSAPFARFAGQDRCVESVIHMISNDLSTEVSALLSNINIALDAEDRPVPRFKGNSYEVEGNMNVRENAGGMIKREHSDLIEVFRQQEIADRNLLDGFQVGQLQDGQVIFNP